MKTYLLLIFTLLLTSYSCEDQKVFINYGENIISDDEFSKKIENNYEITNISGKIIDVCPKKGCWMNVEVGNDTVFVKFKDYGFFVPKNGIKGKTVLMSGNIFKDTISVERLKHYAEDAKKTEQEIASIINPEYKINMIANGVAIEQD